MDEANDPGGDAVHFAPFIPPSTEELDELIPGYKFLQFIERGGMGAVYKAVQKSLNRPVAVKLLPQVHRDKESFAERFRREAQALALLNHPHIVAVHDFGETAEGQMYYVMEYVDGMDLQHLLRRDPPEPKQMLKIITQVCEALQFAHEHGIVHRDIKPANILIDARGNVKVADFGLAKIAGPKSVNYTATGMMIGTPDYIAPEALEHGGEIDHRADIYSLGVMIYEIFTGHVPKGVWEPPSIRSGADKGIDAIVSKAMQNNPEKRYQHVGEMTQVLEKLFKNSDNWKNFRRPQKSELKFTAASPVRIPSNADTILVKPGVRPRHRLIGAGSAVMLIAVAAAVVWKGGWLNAKGSGSSTIQAAQGVPQAVPAAAAAQMKLAEWVFEHDGFLNVKTAGRSEEQMGGEADIWHAADLPQEPFTIWRVSFTEAPIKVAEDLEALAKHALEARTVSNLCLRGMEVPVPALAYLAPLTTLKSLDLSSSPLLTDEAVEHLAACKSLRTLRVSSTRLPSGALLTDKLGRLLPTCKIMGDE